MDIKAAIKYCGGCNPCFERSELVRYIEKQLDTAFIPYDEGDIPDITLIICGCSSECLKVDKYKSKYKTIMINNPKQVKEVIDMIKAL